MNAIQITARLYDARDSMRQLTGEKYEARVGEWSKFLEARAQQWKCDPVAAVLRVVKENPSIDHLVTGLAVCRLR